MLPLLLGLVLFLGAHSVRIFADQWRSKQIERLGEGRWKGIYSLISLVGFVLIVWGYGLSRAEPVVIWNPPVWTRHLAALLTLPIFVLIAAAYIPGSRIKAAAKHPMVAGVKTWAFAHLIANGNLADMLLFGSFMVWAIFDYRVARLRDRAAGVGHSVGPASRDVTVVVVGLVAWIVFALFFHGWLIGVKPFG